MIKVYACPNCGSGHSGIIAAYEDGGGDFGDALTPIFDCTECGQWFTGEDGFIGWEGQPEDNPHDEIPFGNPDLNEVSGGYDT